MTDNERNAVNRYSVKAVETREDLDRELIKLRGVTTFLVQVKLAEKNLRDAINTILRDKKNLSFFDNQKDMTGNTRLNDEESFNWFMDERNKDTLYLTDHMTDDEVADEMFDDEQMRKYVINAVDRSALVADFKNKVLTKKDLALYHFAFRKPYYTISFED